MADVLNWQTVYHPGFVGAFISCMNHAPIFEQLDLWRSVGRILHSRRCLDPEDCVGGTILLILGASDPGIVKDELVPDVIQVLGEEGLELAVLDGGHEIAITQGSHIAGIITKYWGINISNR